jgi:hypothetical protein
MHENVRRFVVANPPCVIFIASLGCMAVGIFVLALRVRADGSSVRARLQAHPCAAAERRTYHGMFDVEDAELTGATVRA